MGSSDRVRGTESGEDPVDWPDGWSVRHVAETGSTNDDLLRAVAAGAPDRSVLVTDHQTAGRGRLDRRWTAPPGANLLVSILFRAVPDDPGELTRRIGLAAIDAVSEVAGVDAALKWPNDILVADRKLAGILAQRADDGSVVVGLGLNVGWAPDGAAMLGEGSTPPALLGAMLRAYDRLPADVGDLNDRYRAALGTIGRRVRVELPTGDVTGTAIDIEADGRLVVLDECAITHRIAVGDVIHLRPA